MALSQMPVSGIRQVIDTWTAEYVNLGERSRVNFVTIFENRGAMMGASNPHPHGQIWANETVPNTVIAESDSQMQYLQQLGSCLLCDYAALEIEQRERVVCINERFVAVVPFWATWPFETLVLARAHCAALDELEEKWGDKYAAMIRLWRNAWNEFIPFLDYDTEIRKVICSTNAIESLNARYRRAVRARGHFPSEQAALKCLYLVTRSLDPTGAGRTRWTMRWKPVINAFAITFGDRWPAAETY